MKRGKFEGVLNIVRFNWPMYLKALGVTVALGIISVLALKFAWLWLAIAFALATLGSLYFPVMSLLASYWIYDLSPLYSLAWLEKAMPVVVDNIIHFTAGFDEISPILKTKCRTDLTILDFYNPARHTEPSIARARAYRPPQPETCSVSPEKIELPEATIDLVIGFLSLHEIRERGQRDMLMRNISQLLRPGGRLVIVEHLRNLTNFCVFGPGFFHFFSRTTWLRATEQARLCRIDEFPITPFVRVFVWEKPYV